MSKSQSWSEFKESSGINAKLAAVRESDMSAIAIMRRGQPKDTEHEAAKKLRQFKYDKNRKR